MYGGETKGCFEPSLGIVFYKDNQICYVIDICLDCNFLNELLPMQMDSLTKFPLRLQFLIKNINQLKIIK